MSNRGKVTNREGRRVERENGPYRIGSIGNTRFPWGIPRLRIIWFYVQLMYGSTLTPPVLPRRAKEDE